MSNNFLSSALGASVSSKLSPPSDSVPSCRTVTPGINFGANCEKCQKYVVHMVGFPPEEGFSLASLLLSVRCPSCDDVIVPGNVTDLHFMKCNFKMKSRSQQGEITKLQTIAKEVETIPLTSDPSAAPAGVNIKASPLKLDTDSKSLRQENRF